MQSCCSYFGTAAPAHGSLRLCARARRSLSAVGCCRCVALATRFEAAGVRVTLQGFGERACHVVVSTSTSPRRLFLTLRASCIKVHRAQPGPGERACPAYRDSNHGSPRPCTCGAAGTSVRGDRWVRAPSAPDARSSTCLFRAVWTRRAVDGPSWELPAFLTCGPSATGRSPLRHPRRGSRRLHSCS